MDVTGKWQGTWQFEQVSLGGGQIILDLKQDGGEVSGNMVVTGPSLNRPTAIQATVSGNQLSLKGRVPGSLTVTGDTMSGVVYGVVEANLSLQRQK